MKILFIAPKYSGGIGGHASRVAEKLQEHGFDIKLMHTSHIPIKKLKNPSFAALSSLKAIVGTEKYDIVHAFNVPSAFAMKYTKAKKKILSIHGIYSEQVDALHSKTISNPFLTAIAGFEKSQNNSYTKFFEQLDQSNTELITILKTGDNTEETLKKLIIAQENLRKAIEGLKSRNSEIIELVKDNEDLVKYP